MMPSATKQHRARPLGIAPGASTRAVAPPPYPTFESGFGEMSVLPDELKGWNWGACLSSWIWGLGTGAHVALWGLPLWIVPFGGVIWAFVCGVKGNEWAWKAKFWASHEQFRRSQHTWAVVGLAMLPAIVGIWIVALLAISSAAS